MEQNLNNEALKLIKRQKRRRIWTKLLSFMACIVVFCTTYALILPAITKETNVFCGYEEHVHEDACYEETLICGYGDETEADPQISEHVHTADCYQTEKQLICQLPECEAHTHSDTCKTYDNVLSCGMEESAGHTHGEECQTSESILVCTLPEDETHTHGDDCYSETISIICGLEESTGHTHSDACYTQTENIVCGLQETEGHTHSDDCYGMKEQLVCEVTVETETTENTQPHEHTDACYEKTCICELEEHEHTLSCYSDSTADLESSAFWESTLPRELTGNYAEDVLAIAKSQLGYTESQNNYQVMEDGVTTKGYTRYGAWYGVPYGDWCAMFVSFCLSYAGVEDYPLDCYCPTWVSNLNEMGYFYRAFESDPMPGDVIFFDWDSDGSADHVGLVAEFTPATEYSDASIKTIEGNSSDRVQYVDYLLSDPDIMGFGLLPIKTVFCGYTGHIHYNCGDCGLEEHIHVDECYLPSVVSMDLDGAEELAVYAVDTASMVDMTNMITEVSLAEKINGTWTEITSGSTVTVGDYLKFTMYYTVPGQTLSAEKNTLYYNLPSNITAVQSNSGNVYNDSNEVVGTFVIDSEAKQVRITFSEEYVDRNEDSHEISGSLSFVTEVDSIFEDGESSENLIFNDNIKIDLLVQEAQVVNGDVSVNKTIASVDGDTITYTIEVTSKKGTYGSVDLTDTMTGGIIFDQLLSITDGDGSSITATPVVAEDRKSFTMALPQMAAGGKYIINYQAKLPDEAALASNLINNKVDVSSVDDNNNPIKDTSDVDYTFELLNKWHKDNGDGTISWTIEVNKEKRDISGWKLSDTISVNGVEQALAESVVIKDSSGNQIYSGLLPYTFGNNSTDTYTVTYTTSHEIVGNKYTVLNKASLEHEDLPTDTPIEDESSAGIGVGDPLKKTGEVLAGTEMVDSEGNSWVKVRWTVTIDTSDGPVGSGVSAVDGDGTIQTNSWYFMDKLDDDQYMTYDQLMAAVNAFKTAVTPYGKAGNGSYRAQVYDVNTSGGDEYYSDREPYLSNNQTLLFERFKIYIPDTIPQGKKITFSYESWAPIETGLYKYNNRVNFNNYDPYEVEGEAYYTKAEPTIEKVAKYLTSSDWNNANLDKDSYEWAGESFDSTYQLDYENLYNNLLCWQIQVDIPSSYEGSLTVTEYLPDGLTLEYMQARTRYTKPLYVDTWTKTDENTEFVWWLDVDGDGNSSNYELPFTVSDDNVISVTLPEELVAYILKNIPDQIANENGHRMYFFIFASIDEDYGGWVSDGDALVHTASFANNVTLKNENGKELDIANQTQVVTKRDYIQSVYKTATKPGDNFVEYSVILNKDGLDLDPSNNVLTVEDIMTYVSPNDSPIRVRLVPGSVTLQTYSSSSGVTPTDVEFTYTYNETSVDDTSNNAVNWTNTMLLTIPDSTAVKLTYKYAVTGKEDQLVSLDNTCSINGIYEDSIEDHEDLELSITDTVANASLTGLLVYKVDKDNNGLVLQGAEFKLYMYTVSTGQYEVVTDADGTPLVFVTDESGMLKLQMESTSTSGNGIYQLAYDTAYKLEETKAPENYILNLEPYEFYVKGSSVNPIIPADFAGHIHVSGDLIYYENESSLTKISVTKEWRDIYDEVVEMSEGSIEFKLFRKTASADSEKVGTYTISAENGWKWSRDDLPKKNANGEEYIYYIEEISLPGYNVSYINNDGITSGTISITNTSVPYELPETGGAGKLPYTLGGVLLMATAALAFLKYSYKPRRKEDMNSS